MAHLILSIKPPATNIAYIIYFIYWVRVRDEIGCVCACVSIHVCVCGLVYVVVCHVLQYTKIKKVGIILITSKDVSLIPPT